MKGGITSQNEDLIYEYTLISTDYQNVSPGLLPTKGLGTMVLNKVLVV